MMIFIDNTDACAASPCFYK